MKYIKMLLIFIVLIFALLLVFFSATIFQEGNPIPVVIGIAKITMTGNPYAKIDENKYIVRANETDVKKLTGYLSEHNVIYTERAGSGYLFRNKQGKTYPASERM